MWLNSCAGVTNPRCIPELTQHDFRKLLATPRPASDITSTPRAKPSAKRTDDGFAKPLPKKKSFSRPKSKDDDESPSVTSSLYRDRAKERREGTNKDYADSEAMLAILEASNTSEGSALHVASVTPSVEHAQSLREQTKYLGGDVTHTHLVKGLDKALLDKIRKEIGVSEDEKAKEEDAIKYVASIHGDGPLEFNSKFAEFIYTSATKASKDPTPLRNDLFLAGRMAFSWDLGIGEHRDFMGYSDIPTVVVRSKADVRNFDRKLEASSHEFVIDKIAQVMQMRGLTSASANHEKKKVKKRDKCKQDEEVPVSTKAPGRDHTVSPTAQAPQPSRAVDDDDDIFAGAGRNYELQVDESRARKAEAALSSNTTKLKLFDNERDANMFDTREQPEDPPRGLDSILKQSAKMVDSMLGDGSASKIVGLNSSGAVTKEHDYIPRHEHSGIQPKKRVFGADDEKEVMQISRQRMSKVSDMDVDLDTDSDEEETVVKKPSLFDDIDKSSEKCGEGRDRSRKPNKKAKLNTEFDKLDKIMKSKFGKGLSKK
ncbi:hypothetical protein SeLEV6574_g07228 [Synchytrium endobioticum]|uniref:RED-like N-terminal domain-containing protein n=1 Tax=Synchytrium endobioticum TaxID=286115 RepID=A0A507CD14_9FUNG|nr:hypothetical protein SeLEV6574_g07228 [Synchytrium endobioticum]